MNIHKACNPLRIAVAITAVWAVLSTPAVAQDWPPNQMTVVIPHGVGGSTNRVARALGDVWAEYLGTTFVYENRAGASTRIGHDYFMRQPKDGSVMMAGNLSTAAIMYAQQEPDWDWHENLYAIDLYSIDPAVLFVRKDSPHQTLADVIDAAKQIEMTFAISQWQSEDTLLLHQIMDHTGAKFEIIPHDVSSQALSQVIGGHIEIGILKVGPASQGGDQVRILAVAMGTNPVSDLTENAPTVREVIGAPVMSVASYRAFSIHKEFADRHPERVERLKETMRQAKRDPRYIEAAIQAGISPDLIVDMSTEEIQSELVDPVWENYRRFGDVFNRR